MDYKQVTFHNIPGCQLKWVSFETHENHVSHETQGLSDKHLVVRRGKPFKLTLLFGLRSWNPRTEVLGLEVWLGDMSEWFPVQFADQPHHPHVWSAKIYPGDMHCQSVTIHICSPVLSSVGLYHFFIHLQTIQKQRTYAAGTFVLLFNPWLKDDPVYMPLDVQKEEYIKSDYGLLYMGSSQNISRRPWSFGQYEPGVLEACLQLLQVSPQHLTNGHKDYILRADPVYVSRVVCAMVNCNDDQGIVQGKWHGSYKDGVNPSEWSSSADILHQWVSSNCKPVCYGQCWVYASVLCTVMRVLGVPSRVVTVFNAAHDTNSNMSIEEYYTTRGEKLNMSNDSVWNFHVWVECWMRRPDLKRGFDGWQVVDPTPQEKSAGVFCCGPCPVAAIQRHCFRTPYDTPFVYASVDADIIRLIVTNGRVVGRMVDTESVGQIIYTKSINSDKPENLTQMYKYKKRPQAVSYARSPTWSGPQAVSCARSPTWSVDAMSMTVPQFGSLMRSAATDKSNVTSAEMSSTLEVSLNIERVSTVGDNIEMCVTVTNKLSTPRSLSEHMDAQLKVYNKNPEPSFWKTYKEVHIQPSEVLKLSHVISPSEYESVLVGDDIVKVTVVIKDARTKERVLATQEFSISSPQITVEIEGGDSIQIKKKYTAHVSFINTLNKAVNGAELTVQGCGLLQGKQRTRMTLLRAGEKIEKKVSIVATSPGTKLLMATFSHRKSPGIVSRSFHKVSVINE